MVGYGESHAKVIAEDNRPAMPAGKGVVVPFTRKKRKWSPPVKTLLILGLLTVGVALFLPQYIQMWHLKAELNRLHEEKAQLDGTIQRLEEEKSVVLSDEYVERMAREKLGLVRRGETLLMQAAPGQPRPLKKNIDPKANAIH